MTDNVTTFADLRVRLADFNSRRDWDRFHNPKDLSVSISIEAGELLENFQWKPAMDGMELNKDPEALQAVKDEVADLFIYLLIMCNRLDMDASDLISEKIERNEARFPPAKDRKV
jgi:dCTP diphosphatase